LELLEDLDLRARMHFTFDGREVDLEVVARSSREEIVVVGMLNYGIRVFAVHLRDRGITVQDAASREYEYLARWTMDALHRSVWIHPPSNAGPGPVLSWAWENERVTESVQAGERTREFSRSGASEPVLVRYREQYIEIQNPWCGYHGILALLGNAGDSEPYHE
jgi:hypothetical protein